MNDYTQFKRSGEAAWSKFGRVLLRDKGSDEQVRFLESCKDGKNSFLLYMEEKLSSNSDKPCDIIDSIPCTLDLHRPVFTEEEFINLERCPKNEQAIWDTFQHTGDAVSLYGFWGYVTLNMIRKEYIQPLFLARDGHGAKTIDRALQVNTNGEIDRVVRNILRSMCNPAPRGKRVIFNDCYLSKSYWRWHWADKMSSRIQLNPDEIRAILDATYYAEFSEKMHSGKSYISSENVLGGLLLYLNDNPVKEISKFKEIVNKISYLSAWKAIEMQDATDNQKEIQQIANNLSEKND